MSMLTPYFIFIIFIFIIGACIGSFLNLVIYRLPLNISIVYPRSHCPECKKTVPTYGLIPIFGFFILLRKCFFCKTNISWRYPLIELFCAVAFCFIFIKFFNEMEFINLLYIKPFQYKLIIPLLTAFWLFYSGIVLSAIDLKYRILPDIITIPGIFIGFILSSLNSNIGWETSIIGIISGIGGLFLLTKLYELIRKKEGMGLGDVKYLGFIGSVVGVNGVFFTLFYASVLGSIVGIIYGVYTKKGLSVSIPFGPFLAVSAFIVYIINYT